MLLTWSVVANLKGVNLLYDLQMAILYGNICLRVHENAYENHGGYEHEFLATGVSRRSRVRTKEQQSEALGDGSRL